MAAKSEFITKIKDIFKKTNQKNIYISKNPNYDFFFISMFIQYF